MRHTSASLLLTQNVHPKIVQERLGHSKISLTLDTYSHILPTMQEVAADAFDDMFDSMQTEFGYRMATEAEKVIHEGEQVPRKKVGI